MSKNYLNKSLEYEGYFKSLGKPDKDSEKLFNSMKIFTNKIYHY